MLSEKNIAKVFELPSITEQTEALKAALLATEASDNFTAILVSIEISDYALQVDRYYLCLCRVL
ncbi:hypothetical protein ACGRH2_20195 [Vibrio barjaei]|uniref:Uncharacterized protein n=2 Tax=Vibrio barjaei TaxID=1676683 RepID=A0ABW7IM50_9VIBR